MFGQFDYNKIPLVPQGTKIVAHTHPSHRKSWQLNGEEGWAIGPSLNHYRCISCYFPKTRSERDSNTVTFFQKEISFPEIHLDDFPKQAANDIISIFTNPPSTSTPSLQAGDKTRNALLEISEILNRADDLPKQITKPITSSFVLPILPQTPQLLPQPSTTTPSPRMPEPSRVA